MQSAIWDSRNNPRRHLQFLRRRPEHVARLAVLSGLLGALRRRRAAQPDALSALGDGGSGNETGNGLTNVEYNVTQPLHRAGRRHARSRRSARPQADPTLRTPIVAAGAGRRPRRRSGSSIGRRPDQPADEPQHTAVLRRDGVEHLQRQRHHHHRHVDELLRRLPAEHDDVGRRRPDATGALLPARLRPQSGDRRSAGTSPAAARPTSPPMPAATCTTLVPDGEHAGHRRRRRRHQRRRRRSGRR